MRRRSDIDGQYVTEADALEAPPLAPCREGNIGGGTGTASRRLMLDGAAYHVGVLMQAIHGIRPGSSKDSG